MAIAAGAFPRTYQTEVDTYYNIMTFIVGGTCVQLQLMYVGDEGHKNMDIRMLAYIPISKKEALQK